MISIRSVAARGARSTLRAQCPRLTRTSIPRAFSTQAQRQYFPGPILSVSRNFPRSTISSHTTRAYSSTAPETADTLIDALQDQYATAKDEFEIATEETEKKTTYAESDRQAAREELDKLKEMYEEACKGQFGEEVQRRVGGRIREIEAAVVDLERRAIEDH